MHRQGASLLACRLCCPICHRICVVLFTLGLEAVNGWKTSRLCYYFRNVILISGTVLCKRDPRGGPCTTFQNPMVTMYTTRSNVTEFYFPICYVASSSCNKELLFYKLSSQVENFVPNLKGNSAFINCAHGSGFQWSAYNLGGPGSILGQAMCGFWWTKWQWEMLLSEYFKFLITHTNTCTCASYAVQLHTIRRTTITRLILNTVRLTHKNTTCCHSTKINITK